LVCQNRAERRAIKTVLHDFEVNDEQVTVNTFADRAEQGPVENVVTLLFAPPPPWHESILVTGEIGQVEIMCFRHELARLRARVSSAECSYGAENARGLDELGIGTHVVFEDQQNDPQLQELPVYELRDVDEPTDEWAEEIPPADSTLWQDLLMQYGQELPDQDSTDDGNTTVASTPATYSGTARLVRFGDAPPVFFREDIEIDVLLDDEDADCLTIALPPGELQAGMEIAFIPGGQRSILNELLEVYDERLSLEARMFEPLWERALGAAIERVGVDALADSVGRTRFAVHDWRSRRSVPQQDWRFKKVLEISGDVDALNAQQPLWTYLTATRGPHRLIGRLNRAAIAEVARDDREQRQLEELERYVGRDLEDIYDQVELVTVLSVSDPVQVPLNDCGRYLTEDDPCRRSYQ
jgi:hypothetical protein